MNQDTSTPQYDATLTTAHQQADTLRGHWEALAGEYMDRIHSLETVSQQYIDELAMVTRCYEEACYDRTTMKTHLQQAVTERDDYKAEVEVGLQLTGSFFEALKPLKLSAIHVENPGRHVTDLITQLQQAVEALAGVTGKLERLQQFVDSGQLMKNYKALVHAAKFIATEVHAYGMQTDHDELDLTTAEFSEVWRAAKRLLVLLNQGEAGHE